MTELEEAYDKFRDQVADWTTDELQEEVDRLTKIKYSDSGWTTEQMGKYHAVMEELQER